jgi:hypothetical protein
MIERPMFRGGAVVPRLLMNLSSSFDHRVVDGHGCGEVRAGGEVADGGAGDAVRRL